MQGLFKCIHCQEIAACSDERREQSQFWQTARPASCYPEGICMQITQGDDAISKCVDDKSYIHKALPCRHVGKITDPEKVRS